jgi:hypothetical protein
MNPLLLSLGFYLLLIKIINVNNILVHKSKYNSMDIYYPKNNLYTLNIEWLDMGMNFAFREKFDMTKPSSEVYNRINFGHFLTNNSFAFVIRNVTLDNDNYLEAYNDINDFAHSFGDNLDRSHNYLATSPDSNVQIIVRNIELNRFPHYFENWVIRPLTSYSTGDHLWAYGIWFGNIIKENINDLKLVDILRYTFEINMALRMPNNNPRIVAIHDKLESLGLINRYLDSNRYLIERSLMSPWETFAFSALDSYSLYFCPKRKSRSGFGNFDRDAFCTTARLGYDSRLTCDENLDVLDQFCEFFKNTQFFPYHFADFEKQLELFQDLPFDLTNREPIKGYHYPK